MENKKFTIHGIGLTINIFFLIIISFFLFLIATNDRYMMIDNLFILDKWTKKVYLNKGEEKISPIKAQKNIDIEELLNHLNKK
jgi:hypothetical protein